MKALLIIICLFFGKEVFAQSVKALNTDKKANVIPMCIPKSFSLNPYKPSIKPLSKLIQRTITCTFSCGHPQIIEKVDFRKMPFRELYAFYSFLI